MAQLNDHLAQFISNARQDGRIASYTQLQLKQAVILKVLHLLGWDAFNASEVVPDFNAGTMVIDYALQTPSGAIFLHVVNPLTERTYELQERVIKTAASNSIRLTVLTDGVHWRLYVPMPHASLHDKEFCKVDFYHDDPLEASSILKKAIARRIAVSGTAFTRAEKTFSDRIKRKSNMLSTSIADTWANILHEADPVFTELLIVEARRMGKHSVEHSEVQKFYNAFTTLTTAPDSSARKMRYDTMNTSAVEAWTNLFPQLHSIFAELIVSDIERVHEFHADAAAVDSFLSGVQRLHEAAAGVLRK